MYPKLSHASHYIVAFPWLNFSKVFLNLFSNNKCLLLYFNNINTYRTLFILKYTTNQIFSIMQKLFIHSIANLCTKQHTWFLMCVVKNLCTMICLGAAINSITWQNKKELTEKLAPNLLLYNSHCGTWILDHLNLLPREES